MTPKIRISAPSFHPDTVNAAISSFNKNILFPRESQKRFEQSLSNHTSGYFVLATNSGSSALQLALKVLNVKEGDEVICPTFSFIAVANAIHYQGAMPVFIDAEKDSLNIDSSLLKKVIDERIKIGKKPAAIILLHSYGYPANIKRIMEIIDVYNIPVIEDCAGALGSQYNGVEVGTFGKLSLFSFNLNKIVTTGGGGALLSADKLLIERAKHLSEQAKKHSDSYEHDEFGFNYIMHPFAAELGFYELPNLPYLLKRKSEIYQQYLSELSDELYFFSYDHVVKPNHWMIPVLVKHESFLKVIKKEFIKNSIEFKHLWYPLHKQDMYANCPYYGANQASLYVERGLCLPCSSDIRKEDVGFVVNLIKKVVSGK